MRHTPYAGDDGILVPYMGFSENHTVCHKVEWLVCVYIYVQ